MILKISGKNLIGRLINLDNKGLKKQAIEGAEMGFTGKQIIHPGQVTTTHEAFSPSKEKTQWAQELIKEFQEHERSGKGAFSFRGSMIDMPLVLQAKNILALTEQMERVQQGKDRAY